MTNRDLLRMIPANDNPARAWLLAIIRALSAEEEGK